MGNPGLLQELPDISALLPQGGGDREQSDTTDGIADSQLARQASLDSCIFSARSLITRCLPRNDCPTTSAPDPMNAD
jgi:hypothetical protein